MELSAPFNSAEISVERFLNASNAALPAPLNLPSSGSAAVISCWMSVPRSVLAPSDC